MHESRVSPRIPMTNWGGGGGGGGEGGWRVDSTVEPRLMDTPQWRTAGYNSKCPDCITSLYSIPLNSGHPI